MTLRQVRSLANKHYAPPSAGYFGCTMEDYRMFPLISKELIDELNRRFPDKSPTLDEAERALMWRGGQRSVVEFLIKTFEDQERSRLGE